MGWGLTRSQEHSGEKGDAGTEPHRDRELGAFEDPKRVCVAGVPRVRDER